MRINIFTAPAIWLYLNKVRKQKGQKKVNDYLDGLYNELARNYDTHESKWQKAPKASAEECVELLKLTANMGALMSWDLINLILFAGEFMDSYGEFARKEAGKIKGKIQK